MARRIFGAHRRLGPAVSTTTCGILPPPPRAFPTRSSGERLCPPDLGPHLLLPGALVLQDHLEELGGEVAVQAVEAAEPVHEREDELRVLGHGQVLVQGLCQRGWAEGPRGQQWSRPLLHVGLETEPGALPFPKDRGAPGAQPCGAQRRAQLDPGPQQSAPPSLPVWAVGSHRAAGSLTATGSQPPLLRRIALGTTRASSLAQVSRPPPPACSPPAVTDSVRKRPAPSVKWAGEMSGPETPCSWVVCGFCGSTRPAVGPSLTPAPPGPTFTK